MPVSNVITIDGPTSSGKSSVVFTFATKIGYKFIDTGAIYRVGSLKVLKEGINASDEEDVAKVFNDLNILFETIAGKPKILVDAIDITESLHNPEITVIVPIVAAYKKVRDSAKKIQRRVGEKENTVMVGRDIGSEIFPDSALKFFLTASAEVRAKRRFEQLV